MPSNVDLVVGLDVFRRSSLEHFNSTANAVTDIFSPRSINLFEQRLWALRQIQHDIAF